MNAAAKRWQGLQYRLAECQKKYMLVKPGVARPQRSGCGRSPGWQTQSSIGVRYALNAL